MKMIIAILVAGFTFNALAWNQWKIGNCSGVAFQTGRYQEYKRLTNKCNNGNTRKCYELHALKKELCRKAKIKNGGVNAGYTFYCYNSTSAKAMLDCTPFN